MMLPYLVLTGRVVCSSQSVPPLTTQSPCKPLILPNQNRPTASNTTTTVSHPALDHYTTAPFVSTFHDAEVPAQLYGYDIDDLALSTTRPQTRGHLSLTPQMAFHGQSSLLHGIDYDYEGNHLVPHQHPLSHPLPHVYIGPEWSFPPRPSQQASATGGQVPLAFTEGPYPFQDPIQTQPYAQQLYPLAKDPSSHISPQSPQVYLAVSGVTPNFGVGSSGLNSNIGGASTIGEPTSSNQRVELDHRYRRTRVTYEPRHGIQPVTFESNLERLQHRCREQGAEERAVQLLGWIFADEVSLEALTRRRSYRDLATNGLEVQSGKVYTALLEHRDVDNRYVCRLCDSGKSWKRAKEVLRHLRRDHFGFSDDCDQWYVFRSLVSGGKR